QSSKPGRYATCFCRDTAATIRPTHGASSSRGRGTASSAPSNAGSLLLLSKDRGDIDLGLAARTPRFGLRFPFLESPTSIGTTHEHVAITTENPDFRDAVIRIQPHEHTVNRGTVALDD